MKRKKRADLPKMFVMKKLYPLLIGVLLFIGLEKVDAQYESNTVTGGYHESGSWNGAQPPANGNINDRALEITASSVITRSDQGSGNNLVLSGTSRYNYYPYYDWYSGLIAGTLNVEGNLTIQNLSPFRIVNGGVVEVWGDFYASQSVFIDEGGTLIVHGNLTIVEDNSDRSYVDGNVIVLGDAYLQDFNMDDSGVLYVQGEMEIDGPTNRLDIDRDAGIYTDDPDPDYPAGENINPGTSGDIEGNEPGNSIIDDLAELGVFSSIDKPTNFTYSNLSANTVDLSWTANGDGDGVVITVATSDGVVRLVDGTTYSVNDVVDGATVVYVGSASPQADVAITAGQDNYFKIWSVHGTAGSEEYSVVTKLTVEMLSSATLFYEDFENITQARSDWSGDVTSGFGWYIGSAEAYMGSNSAYISNTNGNTASYNHDGGSNINRYLEQDIDLSKAEYSSYKSAELSFYWKSVAEPNYDGGSILEKNTDLVANKSLAGQEGWVEKVIDITDYLGTTFDLRVRWYNDRYSGQDVPLCIDELRITGSEVARPQAFAGSAYSSAQIDLSWTKSVDGDDVIVAYSPYGSIGRPKKGVAYAEGDILEGGGIVLYVGSETSYTHTGSFSGSLNYTIWSEKNNVYSSSLSTEVQVPVSLPFSEGFEGDAKSWNFNVGYENAWVKGAATSNTGTYSAYISNDKGVTAGYDRSYNSDTYLELDVDLRGFESASMTFNWKLQGGNSARGEVYVGGSRSTSTEGRSTYRYRSAWKEETVDMTGSVGNIVTVGFRWENWDSGSNPGFCIDDISITGMLENPQSFSATNTNGLYNDLAWSKNTYGDNVIIAVSESGTIGTLDPGAEYAEGDELTGGGVVLYSGDATTYRHEPLKYSTTYTYKIWSVRNGSFSEGIEKSAGTPDKVTVLSEDWEGSGLTWTGTTSGENYWKIEGTATHNGGGHSSYISQRGDGADYNKRASHTAQLVFSQLDLEHMQTATLTFDWKCDGEATYDYGEVWMNGVKITGSREFSGESDWVTETIDLKDYCGNVGNQSLHFYWTNDGSVGTNPGFCIDNIEIGGIYTATSEVTAGSESEPTEISSIVDTQAEALQVFDFAFVDNNSQNHLLDPSEVRTLIQQFVISKGTANTIDDWSGAIAGALLFGPDVDVNGVAGVVTSSGITFNTSASNIIVDNTTVETYQLKIWLNTDLNTAGVEDGDAFDFKLDNNEIVTGWGDDFVVDQFIETGAIPIQVVATGLQFGQQPSLNASVGVELARAAELWAVDINGNVDKDYNTNVVLSNDDGSGGSIGMTNETVTPLDGVASFVNLTFTETGTVMLTGTSGAFVSEESDPVKISQYCVPSMDPTDRYIKNVIVEKINNATGNDGGYIEFLDQEATFAKGNSYDITIGVQNNTGTGYAIVWVDWNGDGDYEDSGEGFSIGNTNRTGTIALSGSIDVPSGAISGATRMRVRFSQRSSRANPCADSNGEIEEYTVNISNEGWLGQNSNWNVSSNWSTGAVPTSSTDVFIPEHPQYNDVFPIINGTASMQGLEIDNNATLTIKPGSKVDITGNVITNSGLIIENTAASPASVIIDGAIDGETTVKWNALTTEKWWYMGYSVEAANVKGMNNSRMYAYSNSGLKYNTGSGTGGTDAVALKITSGDSFSYSGVLSNNASYTFNASHATSKYQTFANPYPCYVDFQSIYENASFAGFESSYWIFTDASNYGTYNAAAGDHTGEISQYIAPGQSVWVKTNDATSSLEIEKPTSHPSGSVSLKGANATSNKQKLRLYMTNSDTNDEILILFADFGSKDFTKYDSEKRMVGGKKGNLYSIKGDKYAVINSMPLIESSEVIPLGYKVDKSGMADFTLKVGDLSDFDKTVDIYLEDLDKKKSINLREISEYTFTPTAAHSDKRFQIKVGPSVVTDIGSGETMVPNRDVVIYSTNQTAIVKVTEDVLAKKNRLIEVYDVAGQLVDQIELNDKETTFDLPQAYVMYIIKVSAGGSSYKQKVVTK